jgi:hypothetical protein
MSKPECHFHAGISDGAGLCAVVAASGLKAARARIRLEHGTLEPVVPMQREKPKRGDREGQSTDAGHRGGTTRSSVDGRVMRRERRGRVIQFLVNRSTVTQVAGGTHG